MIFSILFFKLQRADQEAARNRDANAAAIAALGGGKINKKPWSETNNPFDQPISAGVSLQVCILIEGKGIFLEFISEFPGNLASISINHIPYSNRVSLIKYSLFHIYEILTSSFLFLYFLCRLIALVQKELLCEICSW